MYSPVWVRSRSSTAIERSEELEVDVERTDYGGEKAGGVPDRRAVDLGLSSQWARGDSERRAERERQGGSEPRAARILRRGASLDLKVFQYPYSHALGSPRS